MTRRLVTEWLASFPQVKLNLVADSTGDWLCWCVLRGFGTVLWRQTTAPGNKIVSIAYRAARLPLTEAGMVPAKAEWMYGMVDLVALEKRLRAAAEDESKPKKMAKLSAAHSAAHSPNTVQHTLALQRTGCSGSTLSPYGRD